MLSAWRAAAGAVTGSCVLAVCAQAGCYTHQCDPSSQDFYGGRMIDENTFETNAIDEAWLSYPGNVTLRIHYPMDMGRSLSEIDGWVGVSVADGGYPNAEGGNWSEAIGQLAEFSDSDSQGVSVFNASCAAYFARFVIHFPPLPTVAADSGPEAAQD